MAKKKEQKKSRQAQKPKKKRINFQLYSPDAAQVALAGDFNDWNEDKHTMARKKDGIWQKSVLLEPATYEYKFKVDSQWLNDPNCAFTCPNIYGTSNNYIIVE